MHGQIGKPLLVEITRYKCKTMSSISTKELGTKESNSNKRRHSKT
jgi:hypothetical protein